MLPWKSFVPLRFCRPTLALLRPLKLMVLGTVRLSWISIRAVVALPEAPIVTVPVPNGRDRVIRATAGPAAPESITVGPV